MPIECIRYTEDKDDVWDEFVFNNKRNSTFLHSRKFFDSNSLNAGDDCSLLFYKKNKIVALLPAVSYIKDGKIIFHSHPRSTYGGFVMATECGVAEALEIVEATVAFAGEIQSAEIVIRNPFRIYNQLPSDETDYAMWYHGFSIKAREIESAILLNEDSPLLFEDGTRRSIRKALKTVTVNFSEDYTTYWKLLTENLYLKHGVNPVHTIENFTALRNNIPDNLIKLVTAESEGKMIGGIVLFLSDEVLHAQYIASDAAFQDVRPINAVINFIISWGTEHKFKYLNLGSGNENGGRTINYGLFKFKEGFGGRGILRETMHKLLN